MRNDQNVLAMDPRGDLGIHPRDPADIVDPVEVVGGVGREPAWAVFGALVLRDPDLAVHAVRGLLVATALSHAVGVNLDRSVFWGFALRDVGTLDVPVELLRRPRHLTAAERQIVETHPTTSAQIVSQISGLSDAVPIVRHHHERWDGDGYPDGLAGSAIPLPARVLAVGDTFAALTAPRPHRGPYPSHEAVDIICESAGGHFDHEVSDALAAIAGALPTGLVRPPDDPAALLGPQLTAHADRARDLSNAQLGALFAAVLGYNATEAADLLGRSEGTQRTWSSSLRRTLAVPRRVTLARFLAACGREGFLAFLP